MNGINHVTDVQNCVSVSRHISAQSSTILGRTAAVAAERREGALWRRELGHSRDRSKTFLLQLWINKSVNLTRNSRRNEVGSDPASSVTLVALATR